MCFKTTHTLLSLTLTSALTPVHFSNSLYQTVHDNVPVDGLWIDMNEVSNFCNNDGRGQVCSNSQFGGCPAAGASQTDCCLICETVDNENSYDFPPYAIGNRQQNGALSSKTMSMSALHYGGNRVYDTHNIYGKEAP